MLEEIITWLDSATKTQDSYNEGVELLIASGLKYLGNKLRKQKVSSRNLEKLQYELQKRSGTYVPLQPNQPEATSQDVHLVKDRAIGEVSHSPIPVLSYSVVPPADVVDQLAQEKSRLHGQRAKLSNTLADFQMNDDAGRKIVCDQIRALTKKMNEIRLEQIGQVQPAPKPKPIRELPSELAELVRAQANTRSNISKAKARLKRCQVGSTAWTKANAKLVEHTAYLERINEKLA